MSRHLVLVGGGHAHLETLLHCEALVRRGHRVTLVSASTHHYYTGMGPGLLAGTFRPQDLRFNVGKAAVERGAGFVEERVRLVDPQRRELLLESGAVIGYDVASFNTGSEIAAPPVEDPVGRVFPAKPVVSLLAARRAIETRLTRGEARVVVVGGGPAGVEVAGNAWRLVHDRGGRAAITLVAGEHLLDTLPSRARSIARRSLLRRGIAIREGVRAERVSRDAVVLAGGEHLGADVVLLATGVRPAKISRDSGLAVGPAGGLLVNRFLQCPAHPEIFGGGDAVCFAPRPLPRVGVYAVRQGALLRRNLAAALDGAPLAPFIPQRHFLLILNLGDGRGLLVRGGFVWHGRLPWRIKERIDRAFVARYQVCGERDEPDPPAEPSPDS